MTVLSGSNQSEAMLAPGGTLAFHDSGNELYPGVTEAIRELGLAGAVERDVFVWRGP